MALKVEYDTAGEPQSISIDMGVKGDIEDGVVTIDANKCLWAMYSDESHEIAKKTLLNIHGIEQVNVIPYKNE